MRILYVVSPARFFFSHRLPLALAARRAGHDVHVALPDEPEAGRADEWNLILHRIPLQRGFSGISADVKLFFALVKLFRDVQPDLVHLVTIKPILFGGLAAQWTGVPALVAAVSGLGHIFIERGLKAELRKIAVIQGYRAALSHANKRVIFQNDEDRAFFTHHRTVPPSSTILIRGSGVDTSVFLPTPEPNGTPLVVLPARMLREKGVEEFVRAAELLRAQKIAGRFALVGDADTANPSAIAESQLRRWTDSGGVEWWGHRDDMPAVYAQASIVTLPSYREGLSKTLLEAAACGRPIVTTDVPGCRDAVSSGVNGLLVPPRRAELLASALKTLLLDPSLRKEMGERGRARAEKEFGLDAVIDRTLALYAELGGAR